MVVDALGEALTRLMRVLVTGRAAGGCSAPHRRASSAPAMTSSRSTASSSTSPTIARWQRRRRRGAPGRRRQLRRVQRRRRRRGGSGAALGSMPSACSRWPARQRGRRDPGPLQHGLRLRRRDRPAVLRGRSRQPARRLRARRSCSATGSRWKRRAAYVLRVESLFGGPRRRRSPWQPGDDRGPDPQRRRSAGLHRSHRLAELTPDVARGDAALVEREAPPGLYHCVNSGHRDLGGDRAEARAAACAAAARSAR